MVFTSMIAQEISLYNFLIRRVRLSSSAFSVEHKKFIQQYKALVQSKCCTAVRKHLETLRLNPTKKTPFPNFLENRYIIGTCPASVRQYLCTCFKITK